MLGSLWVRQGGWMVRWVEVCERQTEKGRGAAALSGQGQTTLPLSCSQTGLGKLQASSIAWGLTGEGKICAKSVCVFVRAGVSE